MKVALSLNDCIDHSPCPLPPPCFGQWNEWDTFLMYYVNGNLLFITTVIPSWLIYYFSWWDAQKKTNLYLWPSLFFCHPLSHWVKEGYRTTHELLKSGWVRGLQPIVWASEEKDNGSLVTLTAWTSICIVLCNCKKEFFFNTWFHVIKFNMDKNPHFTDKETRVQV